MIALARSLPWRRCHAWLAVAVVIGSGAVTACDSSGIHPLGRRRDALVACEKDPLGRMVTTSTWVRSTETGTEIVLLGRPSVADIVEAAQPACFVHATVERDSSTTLEAGSYTMGPRGTGIALHQIEFHFLSQPELSILKRDGSIRDDLPTSVSEPLAVATDAARARMTLDGAAMRMTGLGDVIDAIDLRTQTGAEQLFTVYNLALVTSQARLLGFGSGAMTQYADTPGEFNGIVRNQFTVSVESLLKPNTSITYQQFEDLTGIVIDGLQKSNVSTSGDGGMAGTLSFVLRGTTKTIRGKVNYDNLKIKNGVAAGGTYTLTVDGIATPYTLPYSLAANIDLRGVLPVESP
jgi:hypothetical protein